MQDFGLDRILIKDRLGVNREVRQLSLDDRRRFRRFHTFALKRIEDAGAGAGVDRVYDDDEIFNHSIHVCFECFGLNPADFSLGAVTSLLLFRESGETRLPGLLVELEFPSHDGPTEQLDPGVDPDLYALAVIWVSAGGSLTEMLSACGSPTLSFNDLQQLALSRAKILNEAAEKAEEKKVETYDRPLHMPKEKAEALIQEIRDAGMAPQKPLTEAEMQALGL